VTLDASGGFAQVGLALTNAGPAPARCAAAEQFLTGKRANEANITEAARRVAEAATPGADRRGSVEYKREMARVLAGRALKKAVERAGGK
jgi:carbon-monoxide dehydrogenase medium subunit